MMKAPVGGAKHQLLPSCSAIALLAALALPMQAQAAGTRAGSTISNTASASFDTGGGSTTINSNQVDLLVDELLDVTVGSNNPTDVPTTPGATQQVLSFRVTNAGNGAENVVLSTIANAGGDNYDPVVTQIYIDADGNNAFDAATDTLYTPGTGDPLLQPESAITVFVIATTPASVVDGNRGVVSLVAAAKTGTGDPGDSFAGQGEGGGDQERGLAHGGILVGVWDGRTGKQRQGHGRTGNAGRCVAVDSRCVCRPRSKHLLTNRPSAGFAGGRGGGR